MHITVSDWHCVWLQPLYVCFLLCLSVIVSDWQCVRLALCSIAITVCLFFIVSIRFVSDSNFLHITQSNGFSADQIVHREFYSTVFDLFCAQLRLSSVLPKEKREVKIMSKWSNFNSSLWCQTTLLMPFFTQLNFWCLFLPVMI